MVQEDGGLDLKLELVKFVRAEYKLLKRQVSVVTADPRYKEDFPCVAVNRIYDSEDKQGFANFYDEEVENDGTVEVKSALFTQTCELRIWTENADVRDNMFIELKRMLVKIKDALAEKGFGEMIIKAGRDENDFKTYSPLFIYWGVINFTALSPLDVRMPKDTTATPITKVDTSKAIDGIEQSLPLVP